MIVTTVDRSKHYALFDGDALVATDVLTAGDYMATALAVVESEDENAFVGSLATKAASFPALPDKGWLEAGVIYSYEGKAVMVRQSHERTLFKPSETLALFVTYRADVANLAWIEAEKVSVGTRRTYEGVLYECQQAHTTQSDWTPPLTPPLWKVVDAAPPIETPPWVAGVYALDALVTHLGRVWKSLMAANGYEPTKAGTWRDQSVPPMWVAPSGAVGLWALDAIVTHNGVLWRNTSNNNSFAPGVWGWVKV